MKNAQGLIVVLKEIEATVDSPSSVQLKKNETHPICGLCSRAMYKLLGIFHLRGV
ncbi:unnamed protein product [Ceratitis capitata]|uniref:(Mediterranean fruit fly) hypothetical protein n=1 Tax=Ceratitis capitata TaxID=7213 RepID=A0A811USX0_CERCA|nr:unnamed protein product [Ceratitis capitata]